MKRARSRNRVSGAYSLISLTMMLVMQPYCSSSTWAELLVMRQEVTKELTKSSQGLNFKQIGWLSFVASLKYLIVLVNGFLPITKRYIYFFKLTNCSIILCLCILIKLYVVIAFH